MHYAVGMAMAVIFQSAHVMPETQFPLATEDGNVENNWAVHQMITTTNFAPNNKLLFMVRRRFKLPSGASFISNDLSRTL